MEQKKTINISSVIIVILVLAIGVLGTLYYLEKIKKTECEECTICEKCEDNITLLSNDEALSIGNRLVKYAFNASWGEYFAETIELDNGYKAITDVTYEEVKFHFSSSFTGGDGAGGACNSFNDCLSIEYSGENKYAQLGRGSDSDYQNTKLEVKKIEENTVTFKAIYSYSEDEESSKITRTIEKDFVIVKENNNWVIKYYYLPN